MGFDRVKNAIEAVRHGEVVIVVDDVDPESEGTLVMAAAAVTPDHIRFMNRHGRGLICVALTPERADELDLSLIALGKNTDPQGTAFRAQQRPELVLEPLEFTMSVDAHPRFGVTTGISARDRVKTIEVLLDRDTTPTDLRRPGHVFPLISQPGGVLSRVGQTEAAVDLTRSAGLPPVGVICEILESDGTTARRPQLESLAKEHDLRLITVADLVSWRRAGSN